MIYPQGNPLAPPKDSPYLQIGEAKYGRPQSRRGIRYERTGSMSRRVEMPAFLGVHDAFQRDRRSPN
jgi:predicted proteasome-type protease